MLYQVKEVAHLAGISVRTLHHYDQIGLLKPEAVSPAGYRRYSDRDLERLQQIMFFKELDFSLDEIRNILGQPGFDRLEALQAHRKLLTAKKERLEAIIASIAKTIQSLEGECSMEKQEMFAAFDMAGIEKHKEQYAAEVREKYDPKAVAECEAKTAKYAPKDWSAIMGDAGRIYQEIAVLMDRNPADPEVQRLVGEWRQHITNNFYDCTLEIFRGLGDLYVDDPRFTANIDKFKSGLAKFLRDAIMAYCEQN